MRAEGACRSVRDPRKVIAKACHSNDRRTNHAARQEAMPYKLAFAASVVEHLDCLTAAERKTVLTAIERQLLHEPTKETRNRNPLRPNPVAPWELRVGDLRVFYDVIARPPMVHILAIGKKQRNVVRIAGKEIKL